MLENQVWKRSSSNTAYHKTIIPIELLPKRRAGINEI